MYYIWGRQTSVQAAFTKKRKAIMFKKTALKPV